MAKLCLLYFLKNKLEIKIIWRNWIKKKIKKKRTIDVFTGQKLGYFCSHEDEILEIKYLEKFEF